MDEKNETNDNSKLLLESAFVKHPLQNSWTMWYFRNIKGRDWAENLQPILSFNTVEDFWS